MSVKITGITPKSPASKSKIKAGDSLISIGGNEITDVLDYMFYSSDNKLSLLLERDKKQYTVSIKKSEYDDLGLEFASFLMDDKQACRNKCIFCFIDQMPPNMRETLYFKDDDARLSFLQGNYVTLTNLTDSDIERIIKMRLNINVSVHTTNPELRCKMMNNRFAGEKLKYLKQIADSGLMLNCQIVCCPEINDGDELRRTISDLGKLMPSISSVAVVPVGLTKFRENLYPLTLFNKETAGETIDIIESFQKEFLEKYGTRVVFASDEFYITAEREIPETAYYEDYPQYENGIGLLRSLSDEFETAIAETDCEIEERRVTLVTGTLAEKFIRQMVAKAEKKWHNLKCEVVAIRNDFFGETITVTGLITGGDLINQLRGKSLGDELILPSVMLRRDSDVFLDDLTLVDVERELNITTATSANDGYEMLSVLLGKHKS